MKHDYNAAGIDGGSDSTTTIGLIQAHNFGGSVTVEQVAVDTDALTDEADINVELDGNDLFSEEQTLSAEDGVVTLTPDQNREASGDAPTLALDVSSPGDGELDVGVLVAEN